MNLARHAPWVALLLLPARAVPASSGELEDRLRSRWHGAAVVLAGEVVSDCDERYTNNPVDGRRLRGGRGERFAAGELGRLSKLDLHRAGVDLLVDLAVPARISWVDGPYTLYEQVACRVELLVDLPRSLVRGGDLAGIEEVLERLVERHPSPDEARRSARWNGRQTEPLPAGYERTRVAHAAWKAAQVNAAVQRRIDLALETADRIAAGVETEDELYALGFVEGVETGSERELRDCEAALSSSFSRPYRSGWKDEDESWKEGFEDGSRLAYSLVVARRLQGCFLPVPPPPG
ncbi:MAG: hypothetical protein OES32_09955 [Acidobacteriota bacterium]|nr:hypothetical protein [Acidobacteriota bacterium]MDH3523896.1 hypothetical protein [Acidobacteriota bacterium]